MATQASDVIRATTEILRSGRETEQFRVQTALAMLGMAQQVRIQDIEIAGKQLGMLESTNIQQMQSQARGFLTVTGFNQWYNPEDEDWAETMVDDLTDDIGIPKKILTPFFPEWVSQSRNFLLIFQLGKQMICSFCGSLCYSFQTDSF